MKQFILGLLTLSLFSTCYCQSFTSPDQKMDLTKKILQELFSTNTNTCCRNSPVTWIALNDDSNSYYQADTILLFSAPLYYLYKNYCYLSSWTFSDYKTFSLSDTKICQEPPLSTISFANSSLKIRFRKSGHFIKISIYKDKKLSDKFLIVALDRTEVRKDEYVYKLTMVRQKKSYR